MIHLCWSSSVLIFVEGAAEAVLSSDVQVRDLLGVGDRVGERVRLCGGSEGAVLVADVLESSRAAVGQQVTVPSQHRFAAPHMSCGSEPAMTQLETDMANFGRDSSPPGRMRYSAPTVSREEHTHRYMGHDTDPAKSPR
jgi:hypothetical protein